MSFVKPWKLRIDLKDIWFQEIETEEDFRNLRDQIVDRLSTSSWLDITYLPDELELLFDDLALAEDETEFDTLWAYVYDLADFDRVWIGTVV